MDARRKEGKEEACTSCQDLGLGCDLMLPMCFYCGELGVECSLSPAKVVGKSSFPLS